MMFIISLVLTARVIDAEVEACACERTSMYFRHIQNVTFMRLILKHVKETRLNEIIYTASA